MESDMPGNNVSRGRSDRKVAKALERLERLLGRQDQALAAVSIITERIMADKQQVVDEIAKLKQAIQDDQTSDQAVVDTLATANAALQKTIDDLKANGNTQEASDLEDILAQVKDASTAIQSVNPAGTPSGETPVT